MVWLLECGIGSGGRQLARIQIGQQRLDTHHGARLLPGRHDQWRMGVPAIGERAHTVARAGGGVEVDEALKFTAYSRSTS